MTKILKIDESYSKIYDLEGIQEEIIFSKDGGYPTKGTVLVSGGVDDIFSLETKTHDWNSEVISYNGQILQLPIFSKGQGIRLNITTNASKNIKLEILL